MDQYRLLAGISSGRIDSDDLGSFAIEDGALTVGDYETASSLVRRYPLLGWDGGDPGRPDDDSEDDDEDSELEAEADAEDESEPSDESDEAEDADADADIEAEDEDDEESETYTCAGMDGDCTRQVDEPGGLCWQHDDQD